MDKFVVAIDGKTLRGSRDATQSPLHIVSAWACNNSMLLGQVQTDKKFNEITAIPALLKLLSIQGCIVTIDAMGCQKAITQAITQSQADYVLNLKSNHPYLHRQVASWFKEGVESDFSEQRHSYRVHHADINNHGRIETRERGWWRQSEHGIQVGPTTMGKTLKRFGLTLKKDPARQRAVPPRGRRVR